MLYPTFGFTPNVGGFTTIEIESKVSDYLASKGRIRLRKDIKHRGFLVERLVREMYCTIFGITDFDDEDRPYAMVEVEKKDGYHELSPLYARIREYRIYSVNERYNIDLVDFLNMPRHVTDMLISDSRIGTRQNQKLKKSVEDDTRRQLQKEGFDVSNL